MPQAAVSEDKHEQNTNMQSVRKRSRKTGARGTIAISSEVKSSGDVKAKVSAVNKEIVTELDCANPAYVRVDGGLTKNLGDYNSAKIGVSVSLPCLPNKDAIKACYKEASELVDEFMDSEYKNAIGDIKSDS